MLLLFDIQMPVMNGLEMSAAIKRLGLPVIMIVVSGYSEFEYARLAMETARGIICSSRWRPKGFSRCWRSFQKRWRKGTTRNG